MNLDVGQYQPEDPSASLNVVVPKSLKTSLEELAEAWNMIAKALGHSATWNTSKVVNRLLRNGLAAAWADFGVDPDSIKSAEGRKALTALIERNASKFHKD